MDYYSSYAINGVNNFINVSAKSFKRGKREILFDETMFSNRELLKQGYIIKSFPSGWTELITTSITNTVFDKMKQAGCEISDSQKDSFVLEKYHEFVSESQHKKIVNSFRGGVFGFGGIDLAELGINYHDLDQFINAEIQSNINLSCMIKKFCLKFGKFWIRIVRPSSNDNNPPHKDSHLKRLRKNVNIYLPLAGSNELSSLPLIPGSHNEYEQEYIISSSPCKINGKQNTVPCIVHRDKGLNMITPNPKANEIMIFTPHIIHGGGINKNINTTRVSLEMRFFV